jgi:hypothetical protein
MSDHRRSKRVLSNLRHAHCTHFHVVGEENDAALWAESAAQSERCIGQSANPLLANISGKSADSPWRESQKMRHHEQLFQAFEIHIASIRDVKSCRLEMQLVELKNIVNSCASDMKTGRNRSSQIELSVHFDSHFGPAKIGPREQSQRQIDGHGVEGVKNDFDVGSEFLPGIKRLGFRHKTLEKIRPELPVKLLVRVCQSGLGNRLQEAQMVASFGSRIQTTGDVPQSVAPRQLSKGHAVELLTAAKIPPPRIHVVVVHQTVERLAADQIEKLRHNRSARIHALNRDLNSNAPRAL